MKRIILLSIVGLVLLMSAAVAGAAPLAQEEDGDTIYVVEAGDGLIQLARIFYDDVAAYTRIIDATNARAAVDDTFMAITDPNIILVGQKLVIPDLDALPAMESAADEDVMEDDSMSDQPIGGPDSDQMMQDGDDAAMESSPLPGTRWVLTSMNERGVLEGTTVTLNFVDGSTFAATTGCNNASASYESDDIHLNFGPIITTLIACPDGIGEQENDFFQVLENTAFFEITDQGSLWLFDEETTRLATFDPASSDLAGTSWDVVSYNNGNEAVVTVLTGTSITAVFSDDGRLSGSAGCNNYTSPYTIDGDEISIGPVAATRMFCAEEGVMEQEDAYLSALETAATYQMIGNSMEMRTADGAIVAIFARSES